MLCVDRGIKPWRGGERRDGGCAPVFGNLNILFFFMLSFYGDIVSQGYCDSRDSIYDHRANSVLSVFLFLIKKRVHVFTNGCPCSCHAGGALLGKNGKSYVQIEK